MCVKRALEIDQVILRSLAGGDLGGVEDRAFAAQNFEVFDTHLSGHFHPVPGLELLLFRSGAERGNLGDCATMPRNFTVMPL